MRIKNVVKVMNFHSLLRVDASKREAESYRNVGEEVTKIIKTIVYNKNLVLDKNSFSSKVKKTKSYVHFPDKVQMEFKTLTVPYPYIKHYNPKHIELLYGNYPVKNEILTDRSVHVVSVSAFIRML